MTSRTTSTVVETRHVADPHIGDHLSMRPVVRCRCGWVWRGGWVVVNRETFGRCVGKANEMAARHEERHTGRQQTEADPFLGLAGKEET